jgi:hypothetical protein
MLAFEVPDASIVVVVVARVDGGRGQQADSFFFLVGVREVALVDRQGGRNPQPL